MVTRIREFEASDVDAVLALNAAEVPGLGAIERVALDALVAEAALARVAEVEGVFAGFVIAFTPGASYASENYRWFAGCYDNFVYVDRIAVSEPVRGRGIGRALYNDVVAYARRVGAPVVTCEYNVDPPNLGSAAFHARYGFMEVGQQATKGGTIRVSLQVLAVE